MRLLDTLQRLVAEEESPFRAQLAREDVARLRQLQELARSAPDLAALKQRGIVLAGPRETRAPRSCARRSKHWWTPSMPAKPGRATAGRRRASRSLDRAPSARMERLVGCLTTPVPKPADPPCAAWLISPHRPRAQKIAYRARIISSTSLLGERIEDRSAPRGAWRRCAFGAAARGAATAPTGSEPTTPSSSPTDFSPSASWHRTISRDGFAMAFRSVGHPNRVRPQARHLRGCAMLERTHGVSADRRRSASCLAPVRTRSRRNRRPPSSPRTSGRPARPE